MKQLIILFFLITIISIGAVTINIPDDYETIQEGIDAAAFFDIVLVAPGNYIENIDFDGKPITVGSWFYTTQDTSYISQTIIDGNHSGRVVTFNNNESSSSVLIGFKIINGYHSGAGIYCYHASPELRNLIIDNNDAGYGGMGGGMWFHTSESHIFDVVISNNTAGNYGGGIYCTQSSLEMNNVVISDNSAEHHGGGLSCNNSFVDLANVNVIGNTTEENGGGICISGGSSILQNVTISGNFALERGGGLYCGGSTPIFDSYYPMCNIYLNSVSMREGGADIYSNSFINVIVDTFTVMNPTDFHATPLENFSFEILNTCLEQIDADIYVSPEGDNSNSGLTAEDPLQTIQQACSMIISSSENPHTIYLDEGVYSQTANGESFPVNIPSNVTLCGIAEESVILDAEGNAGVMRFIDAENVLLMNITVTNGFADTGGGIYCSNTSLNIENLTAVDNISLGSGGGIFCSESQINIENVTVSGNQANYSAGIFIDGSSGTILNSLISNNIADYNAGGMRCSGSNISITSVTITNNSAGDSGGGFYCSLNDYLYLYHLSIMNNYAGTKGGGIYCTDDDPYFARIILTNNQAEESGGGIYCGYDAQPEFINTTITNNIAGWNGGGIFCSNSSIVHFSTLNRSSIFLNNANNRSNGSDIYSDNFMNVRVDTFTVMYPTEFHAAPLDNFDFDIFYAMQEQVEADLYVSPEGSNLNSGLNADEPLQTIQYANSIIVADSLNPHTIFLAEGIYSADTNNEFFPVDILSGITLQGAGETDVILDADSLTSVIRLEQVNNVLISDLTVINGCSQENGGGIFCESSSLNISNVTVLNSSAILFGGGIYSLYSDIILDNVTISDNNCRWKGGGMYLDNSSLQISNAQIINNISEKGGGIYSDFSNTNWENVTITGNRADFGGGFYNQSQNTIFNDQNRCNIYLNNTGSRGMGVDIFSMTEINVVVDTFTVLNPTGYHAAYLENFTFDIQHGALEPVAADLYVSPQGDNQNSGLDADHPLQTISYACAIILADELNPRTIYLSEGLYSPTANSEAFPIHLPDYVTMQGNNEIDTVLDAESSTTVFLLFDCSNVNLNDLTITNGYDDFYGGGIYSFFTSACLDHVTITNCHSDNFGGGISSRHSQLKLINVTITQNSSANVGGGICVSESGTDSLTIINSIFWENYPHEIEFLDVYPSPTLTIAFTDISGGEDGINSFESNTIINWLNGNIDSDPLFADAASGNFELSEESPCIDAGTDYLMFEYEVLINLDEDEYFGIAPDMGAFEYGMVEVDEFKIENEKLKIENYPNPFNPETQIVFNLLEAGQVRLAIYNLKGQLVKVLVDEALPAGENGIIWDGRNERGRLVSSGVYLVRLQSETASVMKKIMLMK